ncbi:MAG TPA: thioredoxin family protein [Natronosporangium sp.]
MIAPQDQDLLRETFRRQLTGRVRLDLFTQREAGILVPGREPCQFCPQVEETLRELAALSTKIRLTVHDFHAQPAAARELGVERVPCTVVRGPSGRGVKFYGFVTGFVFAAFVQGLLTASRSTTQLSRESKERLRRLREPVHVQLYVTPASRHSPGMAYLLTQVAEEAYRVQAEVVEAAEFPALVQRHGVRGVPATVLNRSVTLLGAMSEADLVEHVARAAEGRLVAPAQVGPFEPVEAAPPAAGPGGLYIPGR